MQTMQSMDWDSLSAFLKKHIRFFFCLAVSLAAGFAAHGYFYTGIGFSQDSLMLFTNDVKWQISLGRFMIPVYYYLRGRYTVPWLLGLYCILYAAISANLIASMMKIRKAGHLALLCCVILTNAAVTAQTATYVHVIDIYMLGFLLATLSVWLLQRFRFGFLAGIPVLMMSVGLYPAYFAAAATLCVLLVIMHLLDNTVSPKQLWCLIGKALCLLIAGLLLYAVMVKLALLIGGAAISQGYNGIAGVGDFSKVNVFQLLAKLYRYVIRFLRVPTANQPNLIKWINLLMGLAALVQLLRMAWQRRSAWWRLVLTGIALLLLPFAANATYFLSKGMLHGVMTMPLYLLYLFVLLTQAWAQDPQPDAAETPHAPRWLRLLAASLIPLLLCIWSVDNIQFSNASYLKKRLEAQSTVTVMSRVIDRIEETEGYEPEQTMVAFIGDLNLNKHLTASRPSFEQLAYTGDRVPGYEYSFGVSYPWSYRYFMEYYLGYPMRMAFEPEIARLAATETVQAMPDFPDPDCVRWVDDILVVKLSDQTY